ncbi:MAG: sugar ABC transporter permease [Eubacteriales bacterium]
MSKISKKAYPMYLTLPALLIFGVFYEIPLIASFILSFTDWNIKRLYEPVFLGIDNFVYIFSDDYFILAIQNTFKFAIITTVSIIILGLLLALALNTALKGKLFFRTIFYLPAVLSLIVVGIMFTSILKMNGGVLNNVLIAVGLESWTMDWLGNATTGLNSVIAMQIWKWSGFAMALFLAGLQSIPKDYLEAARIDGANAFHRFRYIVFPLLAPAFTIVVTTNTIGGFKVFEQVLVLTSGGPGNSTQVLSTYIYKEFAKGTLGRSTAMSLVLFLMISVIAMSLNKYLKRREISL